MKAVFFNTHGELDVLQYGELPDPQPGEDQVLVRLRAAALNRMDIWTRRGWPGFNLNLPHIPGADGAGEIAKAGSRVQGFQEGDRVVINPSLNCGGCDYCLAGQDNLCRDWHLLGETRRGTYAEFVTVPARNVLQIPKDFPFAESAAAALVYQTAWHSLITRGGLRAGEVVLIVGASGGVNTASIQIAKLAGAQVIVVGSEAEKLDLARTLGADELIDRSREANWSKAVYTLTNKRGVDVVVDNVGTTFAASFRSARKGGRILTVGNTGGAQIEIDNRYIFGKHLSLIGSTMSTHKDFSEVMSLVFEGKLKPVLDRSYPLSQARQAQERLEQNLQRGKITLDIE